MTDTMTLWQAGLVDLSQTRRSWSKSEEIGPQSSSCFRMIAPKNSAALAKSRDDGSHRSEVQNYTMFSTWQESSKTADPTSR
jgi:hypothetical protein